MAKEEPCQTYIMANLISIGQIIDRTWDIYTKNFKPLMKISLWGFLVGAFVIIRLILLPDGETETIAAIIGGNPDQATVIGFALAVGISLFAIPITSIWIYMNLVRASASHINKKKYTFKELSTQSWKDFLTYLWVMILKSVASVATRNSPSIGSPEQTARMAGEGKASSALATVT